MKKVRVNVYDTEHPKYTWFGFGSVKPTCTVEMDVALYKKFYAVGCAKDFLTPEQIKNFNLDKNTLISLEAIEKY